MVTQKGLLIALTLVGICGQLPGQEEHSKAAPIPNSSWKYIEKKDAFTGADESFIAVMKLPGSVSVACVNGEKQFIAQVGKFLGIEDSHDVRWKIDSGTIHEESWYGVSGGHFVLYRGDGEIFEELKTGKTLLFEAADFQGTTYQIKFPVQGFPTAFKKLPCSS